MSYFPEVAWGAIAKNVIQLYQEGVFQLNKYLIDVTPLDINEPGAMLMDCIVGDNFIDFLGYVYRIDNIESTAYGLKLLLYDINERSVSEYINYGPYQDRIGYVYRPTKYGIILSQAQILKLDSQARDRIGNIEKGVIWENLFHIDQTYPQTIFGGVPLFSSGLYTDFIDFNLESEIESQEGRLSWDDDAGTLKLGLPGGNVAGQLFQEMLEKVKNESGATIANGKVIYVSGAVGRNIKIGLGDSTDYLKSFIFGVTTEEIANNGFGYICTRGKVGGVNTSSWEVNDKLWLTTNGNMSNIPPEAPGIKVFVGVVLIKHATEGVIDIKPTFIPRMSGLSDVYGTPSLDGQVYSWDTTEQRFILRNLIDSYWEQTPTTYELTYSDGEVFALNSMTVDSIITIGKSSFLDYSMMKLQLGVDPIDNSYGLSQINNLYSSKIAAYASDGKIIYGRESGESGITLDRNSSTFYYVGFNNNNPTYPYHFKDGTVAIEGQTYANGSLAFLNTDNSNTTPHYIGQRSKADGSKGIAIGNGTTDLAYFDIAKNATNFNSSIYVNGSINVTGNLNITGNINRYNQTELNIGDTFINLGTAQETAINGGIRLYNANGSTLITKIEYNVSTSQWVFDKKILVNNSLKVSGNETFVDKKLFIGITSPPSVDTSGTLNSLVWDSSTGEVKQRNISGCSLLLGETSATAYRGDCGKIAYDHSQVAGNPHNATFAQINSKPTTLSGYGITDAYTKNNLQTSGGASVHWNNISNTPSTYTPAEHSHNYAGSITPSGTANSALLIKGTYTSQGGQQPPAYISSGYVRFNMMNTIINNNTHYKDFLLMDTYSGNDVPYVTALGVAKTPSPRAFVMTGAKGGDAWASAELLSTYNYATFTLPASLKGAANGLAELDSGGKVPSSQLPSYVDDVLEYTTFSLLPSVGESDKIYITTDTNKTYRWSGSVYTEISPSLALGETSATAYRGDCGKTAYDHSQASHTFSIARQNINALGGSISKASLLSALNVADGANLYVHPTYTARASGLYKVTVDSSGHVSAVVAVAKSDITALGIPTQDTVYVHPASGVTAGTYRSVMVDVNGHVTTGTNPTTLAGYGITDATPSSINNGRYITDGVNLTGTYVGGSIRMSTQAEATGYPSAYGVTYTFDATTPSRAFSIFSPRVSNDLYIQKYSDSSVGLGWYKIFTTANLNPSNYLTKRYEPYSELTYGGSIIWNCSTGLNKTLTASGNFTINLTNLENGMSGDLRITSSTIITITLPSSSKLNGNVSNLSAGIYHLAWVYNGSVLDFNIALYE